MKDHPGGSVKRLITVVAVVLGTAVAAALADGPVFIHEDARIFGKEIIASNDDGENISVVLGDFKLTLGDRVISGRDGVVWISSRIIGAIPRHDINVYVEGDAQVVEPGGGTTTDKTMYVSLHSDGRILANGKISQGDCKRLPLFQRAKEARRVAEAPPPEPEPRPSAQELAQSAQSNAQQQSLPEQPSPQSKDLISWAKTEGRSASKPAGAPEGKQPALEKRPNQSQPGKQTTTTQAIIKLPLASAARAQAATQATHGEPSTRPFGGEVVFKKPATRPALPKAIDHYYDNMSSEEIGSGASARRVTILRGHVRVGVGDPDSDQYLELRADSAVVFSRRAEPNAQAKGKESEPRSPLSPQMGKLGGKGGESPEGVYLEGDVVISRGDRTFRGPVAYYDFTNDRATVLDPVFHSVQEPRNIPIYIRAKEARLLSAREAWFRDAKISTSEFHSPSYHIGAKSAYMMDTAPYDEKGDRLGPASFEGKLKHTTLNVGGIPLLYWPYQKTDFTQGSSALRSVQIGQHGNLGFGVQSEWHLFRLLGLVEPEGVKAILELNEYKRGPMIGVDLSYARRDYSGYALAYGMLDTEGKDSFGNEANDQPAPSQRGRLLLRHKQILPHDWELQFEFGYVSDPNFLRAFFPAEYFAGKEQETLLYAKKQQDNWAISGLLQYRLNNFDTQTESWPEAAVYLIGQPLLEDKLTFFSENRAGIKQWRPANDSDEDASNAMGRLDSRDEVDLPLHLGPMNLVSYVTGRATYWGDVPEGSSKNFRPYGQAGQRVNTHIWRVYDGVESRMWDIRRLKHIITPEAMVFGSTTGGVDPCDLFPMDPGIEQHITQLSGGSIGVRQRLQTKRGPAGAAERTVDWMRLNMIASFFNENDPNLAANGRFLWYRPEYSLARNNVQTEYDWQISDSMAFLSDFNWDFDNSAIGQANAGLAVARDPRVRYYVGWRYLKDLSSSLATFGVTYKLSRKYTVSFFEQYDLDFEGGQNQATNLSIIRQYPRLFAGVTLTYLQGQDTGNNVGIMFTVWPEGIPEVRLGSRTMDLLGSSDKN